MGQLILTATIDVVEALSQSTSQHLTDLIGLKSQMNVTFNNGLLHQLHRASQRADELFANINGSNLTPRQFVVLSATARCDRVSQIQLVRMTNIDRSTMTDIVRRLVRRKLISTTRNTQDKRANNVEITPKGQDLLRTSTQAIQIVDDTLLGALTPIEQIEFKILLATVLGDSAEEAKQH